MRQYYEPIFYKYAVDLVLNGHMHGYERATQVYQWQPDPCGPMYVTNGHGGEPNSNYKVAETDPPKFCTTGKLKIPSDQPTYSGDGWVDPSVPWCFNTTPAWSAYREGGQFGHSTATFLSVTQFEWKKFLNGVTPGIPADRVLVTKSPPANCNRT